MGDDTELTENEWQRCDELWAVVTGDVGAESCTVAALVAMHESDRQNIEEADIDVIVSRQKPDSPPRPGL